MSVFIIAEAGVNHNGSIELAKKLIDVAVDAKCDAVKFQTWKTKNFITRIAAKAVYQKENTDENESQFDMLEKINLSYDAHLELIEYCNIKGIMFMSAPFDIESVEFLNSLGISRFKIPSGEITNKPLIKYIAKKQKPIILSTGMSSLGEVEQALYWIFEEENNDVTLLHCTTNYPTDYENVNLKAMLTLKSAFNIKVGYSDHTKGIEIPIAAVALGAEVIEKHFTLDKNMEGPDHKASLEPAELKQMVFSIRNVEKSLGNGIKRMLDSEKELKSIARKSIVAAVDISVGEKIDYNHLTAKRPGTGIEPKYIDDIIGKKAKRKIEADTIINLDDFE